MAQPLIQASTVGRPTVLSGMQPSSGSMTLGNYIGAMKNWLQMQQDYDCIFLVVDLHALTATQDPKALRERTLAFAAQYLAAGIDPKQSVLAIQSHIPQHAELAWVLSTFAYMGELNRMTQFKDKSSRDGAKKQEDSINTGLFTYPVLMAADILLYQTKLVPVGADQKQHLELTRDLAQRFNERFAHDVFTMPEVFIPKQGARVMSLQEPTKKMSKSDEIESAYVLLLDTPETILKKLKRAVTDSGTEIRFDETRAGLANLMTIYASLTEKSIQEVEAHFAGKMYGHLKVELAEVIIDTFRPIQQRYAELMSDQTELQRLLACGAAAARERAAVTLSKVYEHLGLVPALPAGALQ